MRRSLLVCALAPLLALPLLGLPVRLAAGGPDAESGALAAIEAEFREVIRRLTPATVGCLPAGVPRRVAGFSSGVLVSRDGLVLSDGDAGLVLRFADGRESRTWLDDLQIRVAGLPGRPQTYRARVIHRDRTADTCLAQILDVPPGGLPHVALGRSDDVRVGNIVFAVGTAFDEEGRAPPTVTAGLVASSDPRPIGNAGGRYQHIYVSAAVNQGVNGGPLLDLEGRLVGTVSTYVVATATDVHQFLGKVIPVDRLREVYARVPAARRLFSTPTNRLRQDSVARSLETVFSAAAMRAARGVVSLETARRAPLSGHGPTASGTGTFPRYQGPVSGVVVDRSGLIVTSLYNLSGVGALVEPIWHPPAGASLEEGLAAIRSVTVHFPDGRRTPAQLLGHDRRLGIALLRADLARLGRPGSPYVPEVLESAPGTAYEAGRFVLAIGNPFGNRPRPEPLLTLGILSRFHPSDAAAAWRGQWQTDAAGLDTNCGGAAVDLDGRLLGLFTIWHPGRHGRASGVAFVVPWPAVLAAVPALERGQGPSRGFLGVSFGSERGPRIAEVIAGTSAAEVGLAVGDLVRRVDREDTESAADVISVLGHRCAGERVTLTVERGGALLEIVAVLGRRPPDAR